MDQPVKVVSPACGQLNREIDIALSPFTPENLVSRNRFGRPVSRQSARFPYAKLALFHLEFFTCRIVFFVSSSASLLVLAPSPFRSSFARGRVPRPTAS